VVTNPGAETLQLGALFAVGNAVMYGTVTVAVRSTNSPASAAPGQVNPKASRPAWATVITAICHSSRTGFVGVLVVTNPGAETLQLGALFAVGNAVMYGTSRHHRIATRAAKSGAEKPIAVTPASGISPSASTADRLRRRPGGDQPGGRDAAARRAVRGRQRGDVRPPPGRRRAGPRSRSP
jgi:drug/metabolite transporter (DMT)-like permease